MFGRIVQINPWPPPARCSRVCPGPPVRMWPSLLEALINEMNLYTGTQSKPMDTKIYPPAARSSTPRPTSRGWQLFRRLVKHLALYLVVAAGTYAVFQFAHRHILQTVQIQGTSMSPTLPDAKCYLLNRVVYMFREPKPAEIVVLRDPETNSYAIKRVVAKPGDSVYVQGGHIYVNGQELPEPYLDTDTKTFPGGRYRAQLWVCGVNQYFVLGDNRNNSADSRIYGTVPRQSILGMVSP
jgi:signal peptidase I